MKLIESLTTSYGQFLTRGTQVSYVTKPSVDYLSGNHINVISFKINYGELKVARIIQIEERSPPFAEADGEYELTLDTGVKVWSTDVAVTDGNFKYGTRG